MGCVKYPGCRGTLEYYGPTSEGATQANIERHAKCAPDFFVSDWGDDWGLFHD
jgi:hypothetical protein